MNPDLLARIQDFMNANNMEDYKRAKSKAIRTLIELGLSASASAIHNDSQISRGQIIETEVTERTEKITRQRIVTLENIKAFFPKNLAELLTFECNERNAILQKRRWLDYDKEWKPINNIVKKHDGEWISDSNESRWILPLV